MRGSRNVSSPLLLLLITTAFGDLLFKCLSDSAFVSRKASGCVPTARSIGLVGRRASGQISFKGADDASVIAAVLSGKKINGNVVEASQDGASVVLSGLDGDASGSADLKAELLGTVQGTPVVFNARKTAKATPLAVAFIDSERIEGVLLVGSGDGKPSPDELALAGRVLGAGTDLGGSVVSLGLPKRWLKGLLGAKSSGGQFNPFAEYIPFAIGLGVILLVAVVFILGGSPPPAEVDSDRSILGD
mmetsp:Transcript_347/g.1020  ORF Transcript_347/g.1020 Transcript_347/m.1020 type:complete len:246 (-) Transcript_347:309-1046(-)